MSNKKYNREDAILLLSNKFKDLQAQGLIRYPKRSDFIESEVIAIKAFLGPWPRALEAAGIKPPRDDNNLQKNREKRIRRKRAKIAAIKRLAAKNEQMKGL